MIEEPTTTATEEDNPFATAEQWEPFLDRFIREEGNYVFTINEAEDATSSNGNPQLFLQLEAREGTIKDWVNYQTGQLGKIVAVYRSAGVPIPQVGEFNPNDKCRLTPGCIARLVGRKVGGVVRKEDSYKDPSKQILRVKGYVEPSRITDDIPADTRGLADMTEVSTSAQVDEDFPF